MDGRQRLKLSLTNRSIGLIPAPQGPSGPMARPSGGPRAAASPGRTPQHRKSTCINVLT